MPPLYTVTFDVPASRVRVDFAAPSKEKVRLLANGGLFNEQQPPSPVMALEFVPVPLGGSVIAVEIGETPPPANQPVQQTPAEQPAPAAPAQPAPQTTPEQTTPATTSPTGLENGQGQQPVAESAPPAPAQEPERAYNEIERMAREAAREVADPSQTQQTLSQQQPQ